MKETWCAEEPVVACATTMASTLKNLLQRFTFWAAGVASVAVLLLAALAGQGVPRTLERLADQRGTDVAARATALVADYVRERHSEPDLVAPNPSLVHAAGARAQTPALPRPAPP